jgi:HB1, ASXL, restriction endonuclease HTH domain
LVRPLAARRAPDSQLRSQLPRRAGAVQEAVIRVLATAERPLQAREIHAAAQELTGRPLSWNTVKDCLHKHARRPDSPIERVSHGRYGHRVHRSTRQGGIR